MKNFAQYQDDQSAIPSFVPPAALAASAVAKATATGNSTASAAVATLNCYINQANADVTKAFGYADQANQAGNCGDPPTPPSPQPAIS
jgi:hypothetical protein